LGTKLNLCNSYHPKIDGQTERVNPISEDMLEVYVQRFHVLGLKKYVLDTNNAIVTEPMEVAKNLVYKE